MRWILDYVPTVWLMIVPVCVSFGLVVLAVWAARRLVPATRDGFHAEISAPMLGAVAALFGLLLAFVIIIGYENFLAAEANVKAEADDLAAIVRDSRSFPEPGGSEVRLAVILYAESVVKDEWPQLRLGNSSNITTSRFNDIFAAFRDIEPRSPQARLFYDSSVEKLNNSVAARRDRLEAGKGGVPIELLALILFSSLVLIFYAVMVGSPSFWFHVLGPATITVVIVASLIVLMDLSYPFSGGIKLSPEDFMLGGLSGLVQKP